MRPRIRHLSTGPSSSPNNYRGAQIALSGLDAREYRFILFGRTPWIGGASGQLIVVFKLLTLNLENNNPTVIPVSSKNLVCARHGRDLMGLKFSVCDLVLSHRLNIKH